MNALTLTPIASLLNSKTEFLKVSFFSSSLINFQSGFVVICRIKAITGSRAILTFSGGFAKALSSFMLSLLTPLTAPCAAMSAGSALPRSFSTEITLSAI